MQGSETLTADTYDRNLLTDLDLSLLQDTGWWDVKYGTGGFTTHGYHAGGLPACALLSCCSRERLGALNATALQHRCCIRSHFVVGHLQQSNSASCAG